MLKQFCAAACAAATGAACLISDALAQTIVEIDAVRPSGERVAGDIVLPDGADGPVPAVMLISGSGAQNRHAEIFEGRYAGHDDWAERLNAAGFAAIRYDEPGTGESEGEWAEAGLFDQKLAVRAILDEALADPRIDAGQVFLLGHSAGGLIAMMLSAEDAGFAGLVLAATPGQPMWDIVEYQNQAQADAFSEDPAERAQKKAELDASLLSMMRRYAEVRESTQLDAAALARMVQSPVLIVHGGGDFQVPPDNARRLADIIGAVGVEAEAVIIPDVNHTLVHDPENHTDYTEIEDLSLDTRLTGTAIEWLGERAGH